MTDQKVSTQIYLSRDQIRSQISDYITICKDILTNTINPYNYGWRNNKDFEVVEMEDR